MHDANRRSYAQSGRLLWQLLVWLSSYFILCRAALLSGVIEVTQVVVIRGDVGAGRGGAEGYSSECDESVEFHVRGKV